MTKRWVHNLFLLAICAGPLGCENEDVQFRVSRDIHGSQQIYANGALVGDGLFFKLPKGTAIKQLKELPFRVETPCGPKDTVAQIEDVQKENQGERTVNVKLPEGQPIFKSTVWLDNRDLAWDFRSALRVISFLCETCAPAP